MKKDCGPSKENEYNSTHIVESMLEEKVNQRDNIEPSSLSEAYSNVSILSIETSIFNFVRHISIQMFVFELFFIYVICSEYESH